MSVHQAAIIETLKDQSAVVTGGSRRLGLGLVEALVELGARVTVIAREDKHLTVLRERLRVVTFAGYHRSSHRQTRAERGQFGHPCPERGSHPAKRTTYEMKWEELHRTLRH
jgi:NAD(P)-dependent dehydrogenase (short-subunit alcohol dehydrogenase family)